ncbi:MAG: hypoxanthine-guanine phosphoribosyltransferase [Pseudomonadales bacterium]|nr:hypoxanthine-guanine phosphoribosyltransferase [Pseudomonadales bacterium]
MKASSHKPDLPGLQEVMNQAECLYPQHVVEQTLDRLGTEISAQMSTLDPVLLCVMNGGLVLCGKLLTRLNFPLQLDYVHASRYREELTGAELLWKVYPSVELAQRHVLIIDDILDEGETLARIAQFCHGQGAVSVRTAVLVNKQHDRKHPQASTADYTGLSIPDRYVFGYGMDYKGYWRNAPGIYAVRES